MAEAIQLRPVEDLPPFERGDHLELAQAVISEVEIQDGERPAFAEGALWRYHDGIWSPAVDADLSRILATYAGQPVKAGKDKDGTPRTRPLQVSAGTRAGVLQWIADLARPSEGDDFFLSEADGVAFADCFVRVERDGLRIQPHDPCQRARFCVRSLYRPKVLPVRFLEFLEQVFEGSDDIFERVQLVREYLGACLAGIATRFQRALVMVGRGGNGKSTVLNVFDQLFPGEFKSSLTLHDLASKSHSAEYKLARLAGRRINLAGEISSSDLQETSTLKAAVDGSRITARNPTQKAFDFQPRAGHVFALNQLPSTTDHSHGFFRRLLLLKFDRTFAVGQRPNLDAELAEELGEIAVWALEGAQQLVARGTYVEPASSREAHAAWRLRADPVRLFIEERCCPAEGRERSPGGPLWPEFKAWSQEAQFKPISRNTFYDRLQGALGEPANHSGVRVYPVRLLNAIELRDRQEVA